MKVTDEMIEALDEIGFNWSTKKYITRSFDERIQDLQEYKRTHGHVNVTFRENDSLNNFCNHIRHARKMMAKGECHNGMALTSERIRKLDALGFKWCY